MYLRCSQQSHPIAQDSPLFTQGTTTTSDKSHPLNKGAPLLRNRGGNPSFVTNTSLYLRIHTVNEQYQQTSNITWLEMGMPLLTRCHWQCLDRLSQIFAPLWKVCFYGRFSIENEFNAGNFCPGLIYWVLLLLQFRFFSKKIEYFGK